MSIEMPRIQKNTERQTKENEIRIHIEKWKHKRKAKCKGDQIV